MVSVLKYNGCMLLELLQVYKMAACYYNCYTCMHAKYIQYTCIPSGTTETRTKWCSHHGYSGNMSCLVRGGAMWTIIVEKRLIL